MSIQDNSFWSVDLASFHAGRPIPMNLLRFGCHQDNSQMQAFLSISTTLPNHNYNEAVTIKRIHQKPCYRRKFKIKIENHQLWFVEQLKNTINDCNQRLCLIGDKNVNFFFFFGVLCFRDLIFLARKSTSPAILLGAIWVYNPFHIFPFFSTSFSATKQDTEH